MINSRLVATFQPWPTRFQSQPSRRTSVIWLGGLCQLKVALRGLECCVCCCSCNRQRLSFNLESTLRQTSARSTGLVARTLQLTSLLIFCTRSRFNRAYCCNQSNGVCRCLIRSILRLDATPFAAEMSVSWTNLKFRPTSAAIATHVRPITFQCTSAMNSAFPLLWLCIV